MDQKLFIEMNIKSAFVRGRIIGLYTGVESLIDDIIKNTLFNDKEEFNFYLELFGLKDKLNGTIKSKSIKHCLEKYDKKKGTDTKMIRELLDNLTVKRNMMAHWILDTSEEGIELYNKEGKFKFIRNNEKSQQETLSLETVQNLERSLNEIMVELIKVQQTYVCEN